MVSVPVVLVLLSAVSPPVHSLFGAFYVTGQKTSHDVGQQACKINNSNLVSVYTEDDNTEIRKVLMTAGVDRGWIGLRKTSTCSVKWSNGDPVTFTNLDQDCSMNCVCAAMKADGKWENRQCAASVDFMCYSKDATSLSYHYISENKTWSEAQRYCRENYTDLVSIGDATQNQQVMDKRNGTAPFWIGLLCDGWQWVDGGSSSYRRWSVEPEASVGACVVLNNDTAWKVESCSNNHTALCYKSFVHVSDEMMNWENALDYCQKEDRAGLLTITSVTIQKEVENVLRGRVLESVWVGLRRSQLFGFWIWSDKSTVYSYSNWDGEKAPDVMITQNCGAVDPQKRFRWKDQNCLTEYRALCQVCV